MNARTLIEHRRMMRLMNQVEVARVATTIDRAIAEAQEDLGNDTMNALEVARAIARAKGEEWDRPRPASTRLNRSELSLRLAALHAGLN